MKLKRTFSKILFLFQILWIGSLPVVADLMSSEFDPHDPPEGLFLDDWMEIYILGQKAGYGHLTLVRKGDEIHSTNYAWLKIARGSVGVETESSQKTRESLTGKPLSFAYEVKMANQPVVTKGAVEEDTIEIELSQNGAVQKFSYPFPAGALMAWGAMLKGYEMGFEPGTEYTLKLYNPEIDIQSATNTRIKVIGEENIELGGKQLTAHRTELTMYIGGMQLDLVSWVDSRGRMLRTQSNMMGMPMEMILTDEKKALANFVPVELFDSSLLQLEKEIPADAKKVAYRITYKEGKAGHWLPPATDFQEVLNEGKDSVLVTVTRADHQALQASGAATETAELDPAWLEANMMINTEDAILRQLYETEIADSLSKDVFTRADQLRQFVGDYIEDKNLNIGFATASEVARNPEGDCSEHAVLLAAMGRLSGIPSRVAMGLAYLPRYETLEHILGYHMWTQFYLGGKWVDIDAALGETECTPSRITLLTPSLNETSMTEMGLSLMKFIGQVEIEMVIAQ